MGKLENFVLDDVLFIPDIREGPARAKSSTNAFVLVKTTAFLQFYKALRARKPRNILEIGMFEGGSLVLFDKLYNPEKLVGIDIRADPIQPLEEYCATRKHIRTHYNTSQNDKQLPSILATEFPKGIDLIIDDASHQYELSRATFHLCFPLLKPGGLYVLEDWAWSHTPAHQQLTNPWHEKPALTNLVVEFVLNMPNSVHMNSVTVHRHLVAIEKAGISRGKIDLSAGHSNLRSRQFTPI